MYEKDINCKVLDLKKLMKNWPTFHVFGAHRLPGLQSEMSQFFYFFLGDDKPIPAYDVCSQARQEGSVDSGFARFLLCLATLCVSALHNKSGV